MAFLGSLGELGSPALPGRASEASAVGPRCTFACGAWYPGVLRPLLPAPDAAFCLMLWKQSHVRAQGHQGLPLFPSFLKGVQSWGALNRLWHSGSLPDVCLACVIELIAL